MSSLPAQIISGDYVEWLQSPWSTTIGLASSTDFDLLVYIRGAQVLDLVGIAQPSGSWQIQITTALKPGLYSLQVTARHQQTSQKFSQPTQQFEVLPSLSQAALHDPRSRDERELERVQNAIAKMVEEGVMEIQWPNEGGGTAVEKRITLAELREWERALLSRVYYTKTAGSLTFMQVGQ